MYDSNRTRPETSGQLSALSPDASWPEFMQQAALCFLGQPHKRYRGEWRYGSRSSLAVHVEGPRAGTWRDFEGDAGGGVLDFLQHFAGLDHDRAVAWLGDRPSPQASRPTNHIPGSGADAKGRLDRAQSRWAASKPIPFNPDHPARRWLFRRKLWRPELPLPQSVGWIDDSGPYKGSGTIIALAAPPSAWADAWPQLPPPTAVHLAHLDAGGQPAMDRPAKDGGLTKRTHGSAQGAVLILGNPILCETLTPVRVVEGLADTLALASRYRGPVVCSFGTSGLQSPALAEWLVSARHGVLIHSDRDPWKDGRPPPGRRAAALLRRATRNSGGAAEIVPPALGFKDFGDEAAAGPDFAPLPGEWAVYARTLAEMHPGWPPPEISRISAIAKA